MADLIQVAQDTKANIAAATLELGEPAWMTDTKEIVVGDGATAGGILQGALPVESVAPSSTATTTLAIAARDRRYKASVAAAAGAGAYTHKVVLPITNKRAGDECLIYVTVVASANPSIEIRNDTASGTTLATIPGDAAKARAYLLLAVFNGSAWTLWDNREIPS